MGEEIIRQPIDSEYHSIFYLSHTSCRTTEGTRDNVSQGTYIQALWAQVNYQYHSVLARWRSHIILYVGKEVKIKYSIFLDLSTCCRFSAEREKCLWKIFEPTNGKKNTVLRETSMCLLQQVGRTDFPVNAYFAAQLQEQLEHNSSTEHSLDNVLSRIIEHHNCMQ